MRFPGLGCLVENGMNMGGRSCRALLLNSTEWFLCEFMMIIIIIIYIFDISSNSSPFNNKKYGFENGNTNRKINTD